MSSKKFISYSAYTSLPKYVALRAKDEFTPFNPNPANRYHEPYGRSHLLDEVFRIPNGEGDRERRAAGVARAIRRAGAYRWVGLYKVTEDEIVNLAFDGLGVPAHPRFPVTKGLSGAAVVSGETVLVGDVSKDPRYLTAFGSTRSEIIVPIVGRAGRKVVGTIDVESEKVDAFTEGDRAILERCATAAAELL